jgi:hypothetical protein
VIHFRRSKFRLPVRRQEHICRDKCSGGILLHDYGISLRCSVDHYWSTVPAPTDDECGAVGGMRIGRRNWSTRRRDAPLPLCPPQLPHNFTWDQTQTAAVGNQRLTAWAMARPFCFLDGYRGVLHTVNNVNYPASPSLTLHRCRPKYHAFQTSEVDVSDWSASQSDWIYPAEGYNFTHWSKMSYPTAGLDVVAKGFQEPSFLVVTLAACLLTYSATEATNSLLTICFVTCSCGTPRIIVSVFRYYSTMVPKEFDDIVKNEGQ